MTTEKIINHLRYFPNDINIVRGIRFDELNIPGDIWEKLTDDVKDNIRMRVEKLTIEF